MAIILPNLSKDDTAPNLFSDIVENDVALKEGIETETSERKAEIANQVRPVTWYEPKIIATEQSTSSTNLTKLTTPDEISGVVVPQGGLMRVGYLALWSSTVAEAGRASLSLNGNQVLSYTGNLQAKTIGTTGHVLTTCSSALYQIPGFPPAVVPTAPLQSSIEAAGVPTMVFPTVDLYVSAGTYNVSVEYKVTSGSVSAKERKLWVEVHGG